MTAPDETASRNTQWKPVPAAAAPGSPSGGTLSDAAALYDQASDEADHAITYYARRSRGKKLVASGLRLGALLALSTAGILTLLATDDQIDISPVAYAVAAAVAGALAMIDRFFGFSASWMRFVAAALALRERLVVFKHDWQDALARTASDPEVRGSQLRALARSFEVDVQRIMREETETWIREFSSSLRKLDSNLRQQLDRIERASEPAEGVLVVHVPKGDRYPDGWSLAIDSRAPKRVHDTTSAVESGLTAGDHTVTVTAVSTKGKAVHDESRVTIRPGAVATVELSPRAE